ncbi:hypothetical protein N7535_000584 [Penicillium sp. DV-2018c]|nr:hypothetical protein N7461_006165 [Penicillium sp. DV-2018c]KAJ5581964.1 hypothetical protein N7535_000584 [Penicillium sp. DV-2018c]
MYCTIFTKFTQNGSEIQICEINMPMRFPSSIPISWSLWMSRDPCDKRAGIRRTGWSPRDITPVQVSKFHRDKRYLSDPGCKSAKGHLRHAGLTIEELGR